MIHYLIYQAKMAHIMMLLWSLRSLLITKQANIIDEMIMTTVVIAKA